MAARQICVVFIFIKLVTSASITKDVQSPPINDEEVEILEPKPLVISNDETRPDRINDDPKLKEIVDSNDTKKRKKREVNFEKVKNRILKEVNKRKKRDLLIVGGKIYKNVYVEYYNMERKGKFYVCKVTSIGSYKTTRCMADTEPPGIIIPSSEEFIISTSSSEEFK